MRDQNTPAVWSPAARLLHWLVAIAVFVQIGIGARIGLLDMYDPADVAWYKAWVPLHKSIGLAILLLMVVRVLVRLRMPVPARPAATPTWQQRAARVTHVGLYVLLIVQPVLGYVQSAAYGATTRFFSLTVPNIVPDVWRRPQSDVLRLAAQDAHKVVAALIAILLVVHVLGALKHHFKDRDDVLRRMLFGPARL